ncbi:QcrA and Rieske domain-containing protein [Cellulomonas gelida]|uniref:Cytochrome bc1 complex Rieske iron-sulfur subunit n=1 Tax=Cellulomonas gelida TaxID=1712 RepID=A0A4Y3KPC2_9CELL|nr:Rieske (2Fe-2S) protein [Cellulomonas gelida]GEA85753.1 hypothetical protein CGE01nite_30040 [Cellulomonas gelida]GGL39261.1 hypothetical protein GCM10009774_32490 [Cellulomonas gelida]
MTSTTTTGPVSTAAVDDVTQGHHDDTACAGCLDRRQLLTRAGGAGIAVAAAAVLAACGSSSSPGGGGTDDTAKDPAATPGADGATPLAQVADVPVGGALLVENGGEKVLLVQATAGTITAVSAICTHQGCTVQPAKDELDCPCHGSKFTLEGANISGPADKPLPAVDVHVKDGAVFSGTA